MVYARRMTIAVVVKTGSAIVFAADSRCTAENHFPSSGADGKVDAEAVPYDNMTKVGCDDSQRLMVVTTGSPNVGPFTVADFVAMQRFPECRTSGEEEEAIADLFERMAKTNNVDPRVRSDQRTRVVFAAISCETRTPRIWEATVTKDSYVLGSTVPDAGFYLFGESRHAAALLHGYDAEFLRRIGAVTNGKLLAAANAARLPMARIVFSSMQPQDAIDLAVFLATVQIEMERFQGGGPCGGEVDVMLLRSPPHKPILFLPGKGLRHPYSRSVGSRDGDRQD